MNLLSWAGREIKGGLQTVNRDIIHPVQQAFTAAPPPQQQRPNPIPAALPRQGQPGFGVVRPGATVMRQPAPLPRQGMPGFGVMRPGGIVPPQKPKPSILDQIENSVKGVVQGAVNPASKVANEVVALGKLVNPAGSIAGNEQSAARQLAPGQGIGHQGGVLGGKELSPKPVFIGPGSMENIKKTVGTGVSLGTTFAAPEAGLMQSGNIAARIAKGAVAGAGIGAAGSAGQQLAETGKVQLKPTLQGAALGAVLGGGAPAIHAGAKAAIPVIKDNLPNEKGFVKIPTGKNDPAPDLHPKQKEFINEYANMLENMGSGNGVDILPDGRRVSNNFRTAENQGKAMTKQDWFDQARKELQSGKGAYGASDEYKTLSASTPPTPSTGPRKGVIIKESAPMPDGTKVVIKAARNPATGHLDTFQERIAKAGSAIQSSPALKPDTNLDRGVQDVLRTGTVDEAMNHVMQTKGVDLQTASKYVSRVAQQSGVDLGLHDASKNPLIGTVGVPKVRQGDVSQANLNAKFVHGHEQRVGQQALDSYKKLSPNDQVRLKSIETNTVDNVAQKADNPQAFKEAAQSIRSYYDTRHAYDRYLGINVGYRTNYLRQVFDRVDQQAPDSQISLKGSNKYPGYTKQRSNETLGADVGNALQKDVNGSSFNHAKLTYEQGLNEALNGKVAKGELVRTQNDGAYQQLLHPYGQDLSVPKDIAQQINSRTWQPTDSKALQVYDSINHGLKYVKLSGGLFHAFTEAGNFVGQQGASGKLFTDPMATARLAKVFFSKKGMATEVQRMTDQGVVDNAHISGLTITPKEIKADVNVSVLEKGTSKVAKYTGVQAMHDATFKREIPYAKLKMFEQKTKGLDPNNSADLAKMRETARAINNVFGGINREINGIKPETFRYLQRLLLATDFTESKWHTLFDAATHGGPAGTIARQTVAGKALLFGILASAGAAASGDYKGKTAPQIGKDAAGNLLDPSFKTGGYTVGFPKTHISEAVGAVKPYNQPKGAPWNASGVLHYGESRTAALPSEAIQLLSNKNYYGQPIYGKNTKKNGGGPISPASAAFNVASTVLPIPVGQGTSTFQGKQSVAAAGANVLGLNARKTPAPKKPAVPSVKAQVSSGAKQPTKGIYTVKGKDGTTKYATLQGSTMHTFTNVNDAKTAQQKNIFKYSKDKVTTIGGEMYHKSSTGTVVKGAPPVPTVTASTTAYDPKTNTWTKTSPTTGKVTKIDASGTQTVVDPGIGSISNARPDYVANIRKLATKYNVDPNAAMAVAAAEGLGGGVGDNGTSFGPFQLHVGGALPQGKDQAWAESPAGIEYALQEISKVAGGRKGQDAINAIVNGFEKPLDPNGEVAKAIAVYTGSPIRLTAGSAKSGKVGTSTATRAAATALANSPTAIKLRYQTHLPAPKIANPQRLPSIKTAGMAKPTLKTFTPKKFTVSKSSKVTSRRGVS